MQLKNSAFPNFPGSQAAWLPSVPAWAFRISPRAQSVAVVQARSSDKQSQRKLRRIKLAPAAATYEGAFFARDYFLTQATIAAIMPITLRTAIMPAGMTLPVRKNLGTNCAASK